MLGLDRIYYAGIKIYFFGNQDCHGLIEYYFLIILKLVENGKTFLLQVTILLESDYASLSNNIAHETQTFYYE